MRDWIGLWFLFKSVEYSYTFHCVQSPCICMLSYFPCFGVAFVQCIYTQELTQLHVGLFMYMFYVKQFDHLLKKIIAELRSTFFLPKHFFNFNVFIIYFLLMLKCSLFPFFFVLLLTNLTSSSQGISVHQVTEDLCFSIFLLPCLQVTFHLWRISEHEIDLKKKWY